VLQNLGIPEEVKGEDDLCLFSYGRGGTRSPNADKEIADVAESQNLRQGGGGQVVGSVGKDINVRT